MEGFQSWNIISAGLRAENEVRFSLLGMRSHHASIAEVLIGHEPGQNPAETGQGNMLAIPKSPCDIAIDFFCLERQIMGCCNSYLKPCLPQRIDCVKTKEFASSE